MTNKPTTVECIEWLMKIILADGWTSNPKYTQKYNAKVNAVIRAKLNAADEMAKALRKVKQTLIIPAAEYVPAIGDCFDIIDKADALWREASNS